MSTWKTTARVWNPKTKAPATVVVELEIDWQAIANDLAQKAIRNKSKKSKLACGIVATVRDIA